MNKKTILEFAEEIGISKKQVENKLAKLKKQGTYLGTLEGGKRYLNLEEQNELKALFNATYEPPKNKATKSTFKVPKDENLGSGLGTENKYYIEQIEGYKEQVKVLSRLLENQQILTKQAQDQSQNLLLENTEIKEKLAEVEAKSFWSKLFKRKN